MAHRGLTRTLFTTEIHATAPGYDFAGLKDMLAWRDTIMTTRGSNHRWRGETASAHGYHQHGFGRIVLQSLPQVTDVHIEHARAVSADATADAPHTREPTCQG